MPDTSAQLHQTDTSSSESLVAPHLDALIAGRESSPWWLVDQAAAYLQLCTRTVRREAAEGRLRHARVGGRRSLRFKREWCDEFMERFATPSEVSK